jgi:hypothetical protein
MKNFSDFILEEQTVAEKDLSGGRFTVDNSSITYKKGGDMNMFQISDSDETISIVLRVNNKEVVLNDLPKAKFIMKMREFLASIK